MKRSIRKHIVADLEKNKIVFLVGPRQVGKTWLAKDIQKDFERSAYLNYDSFEDRDIIQKQAWLPSNELLVLDELHKMPDWKNYLKGVFDTKPDSLRILVTGSARLDIARQVGDSLAGRYFVHHLFPFTINELYAVQQESSILTYYENGGFPEPFLSNNKEDVQRWRHFYIDSLIRTDILEFQRIQDIRQIQLVFDMLRRRVGSPVSFKSIAEDVQIAPNTVKRFIEALEALYIIFRITPYSRNIERSLLKEPKIYFYDHGLVENGEGPRFENIIALELLRFARHKRDQSGIAAELNYIRTKDGREIDFCYIEQNIAQAFFEVKVRDTELDKNLKYFHAKYSVPSYQILQHLRLERTVNEIQIRNAESFCRQILV